MLKFLTSIGAALTLLGLIDLPEQLNRWKDLASTLLGIDPNALRWIVVCVGVVLILFANDIHRKLWHKYKGGKLGIRFSDNDPTYWQVYPDPAGTGLDTDQLFMVDVLNKSTAESVENVKVELIDIKGSEGNPALPITLRYRDRTGDAGHLAPKGILRIDVAKFIIRDTFRLAFCGEDGKDYQLPISYGNVYTATLRVSGRNDAGETRDFVLGLDNKSFFMRGKA